MFTFKFMGGKDHQDTVVCGMRYDVRYHRDPDGNGQSNQAIIEIFQKITSDETGISWQVGGEHPLGYNVCYIENQSGKTIDRIGPFG